MGTLFSASRESIEGVKKKAISKSDSLLKGIRVLDLADEKASFCSKLLADMGAYVIKVEKPRGDVSRDIGPFWNDMPHPEKSLFFWYHNTNKRGITLNIEHNSGREIFCRLLKKTDIVVETFPPGYLKELGLGFEVLRDINPRLILASVTGFGQNGPRKQYQSCDLVASAMGGQMYISGSPLTPPLKPCGEQSYYTASLFAAIGILLALRKRNQSGKGEHIDISLQEAVTSTLENVLVRYFNDHMIPTRQGSLYWNNEFCIVPCKDGFIRVTLFQQWETLVAWLDSEGMAGDLIDNKWADEEYRLKHLDRIIEVLKRWTQIHTKEELLEMGQLMGFPWAPVFTPQEVIESHQLKERGFFVPIDHPNFLTCMNYPGLPYQFTSPMVKQWRRAPLIGEDNILVFQGELGLSKKEIKKLISEGTI
jgi:crotonobetainyl-CoA:carnitine CoA-transferase CaiB-like acyl-CoA transferase